VIEIAFFLPSASTKKLARTGSVVFGETTVRTLWIALSRSCRAIENFIGNLQVADVEAWPTVARHTEPTKGLAFRGHYMVGRGHLQAKTPGAARPKPAPGYRYSDLS